MATLSYNTGGPGQRELLGPTVPSTGGNLPPEPVRSGPSLSNPLPANPVTTASAPNLPATPAVPLDPNSAQGIVQGMLNGFLDPANPLMAHATQAGLDTANQRGLINSSIAAGASRRAAMDSIMPLMGQSLDIFNRREGENFTLKRDNSQAELSNWLASQNHGRTMEEASHNAVLTNWLSGENHIRILAAASHQAGLTDWLSNQQYTREFNGALSMLPIVNSFQLSQLLAQYAIQNPQTYPPSVVSGLTNFLNENMFSILKEYFPNLIVAGSGGGTP